MNITQNIIATPELLKQSIMHKGEEHAPPKHRGNEAQTVRDASGKAKQLRAEEIT